MSAFHKTPRTFVLTVKRTMDKYEATRKHLEERGIKCEPFFGADSQVLKLKAVDQFNIDRLGDFIGPKHITAQFSHLMMWNAMLYCPEDSFFALEYDARFTEDWKSRYDSAIKHLPDDWDIVFIGSCCAEGRIHSHLGDGLYDVRFPLCGHALQLRKKALPILIETHTKFNMPLDIAMMYQSLPKLRVFTVLPRLVSQENTFIPP